VRGVISAWCPHKKDDPSAQRAEALEPQFAIALAFVFHRDHGRVEDGLEFCKVLQASAFNVGVHLQRCNAGRPPLSVPRRCYGLRQRHISVVVTIDFGRACSGW
jgi:hypothetical protein